MRKVWFIGALLATIGSVACRRTVIVRFDAQQPPASVSAVWVWAPDNHKQMVELRSLMETVGFWDIPGPNLHLVTWVCSGDGPASLFADNQRYPINNDEVTVNDLGPAIGNSAYATETQRDPCIATDAGVLDASNDAGDAGVDSGMQGNGCSNPADTPDAGGVRPPPTIDQACVSYCNTVLVSNDGGPACGIGANTYDSVDQCLRYCTLVNWSNSRDPQDTLHCREEYASAGFCNSAGPNAHGNCGASCPDYCYAWSQLCDQTRYADCEASCIAAIKASANSHEPDCRFQLLPRAVYDMRYCEYLDYGNTMCTFPCTSG